ncbi:hypothetical protein SRABI80_04276 [Peribacillus frigoritolerans]|nr:hypothetical protein SRABI80_04276 [Peribacillus frigoritolerans]
MPMIIKMGAMALSGITLITGINNSDRMNSTPVTTEVRPVLPPDAIPAAVSTVATVGLEPNKPDNRTDTLVACSDFL